MNIKLSKKEVLFITNCIEKATDTEYTDKIDRFIGKLLKQAKITIN